jgi:hypothetical protein
MFGGHFLLVTLWAQFCAENMPNGGLTIVLLTAVISGSILLKVQERIEAYFIRSHIKKRPNSGWAVVAARSAGK